MISQNKIRRIAVSAVLLVSLAGTSVPVYAVENAQDQEAEDFSAEVLSQEEAAAKDGVTITDQTGAGGDYIVTDMDQYAPSAQSGASGFSTEGSDAGTGNGTDGNLAGAGTLPAQYQNSISDLTAKYPEARNQGNYATCWAFAAAGLAELNRIKAGVADRSVDYSELALAYSTYTNLPDPLGGMDADSNTIVNTRYNFLTLGGSYWWTVLALSKWWGMVDESLLPYSEAEQVLANGADPAVLRKDQAVLIEAQRINREDTDLIKRAVMENGGAAITYYNRWSAFDAGRQTYYNAEGTRIGGMNHGVVIVGWDDTFPAASFSSGSKPSGDGAWLVRSSWGPSGTGNEGYFWMSYYEPTIEQTVYSMKFAGGTDYDNNYQYDGAYGNVEFGLSSGSGTHSRSIVGANIFTAKSGARSEILKAVQVGVSSTSSTVKVDVYTGVSKTLGPESGTPVASASASMATTAAGLYTVQLAKPVPIPAGASFSVVVTVTGTDTTENYGKIMAESSSTGNALASTASAQRGESWYKAPGASSWKSDAGLSTGNGLAVGNLRIKAFTSDSSETVAPVKDDSDLEQFVTRLYENFLGREPDAGGFADWVGRLKDGRTTGSNAVYGFIYSREFQAKPLSDPDYVTAMYRTILGREPDTGGLADWTGALANGCTRKYVLQGFLNSAEFTKLCASLGIVRGTYQSDDICDRNPQVTAFVARLYKVCLNRSYDRAGLSDWTGQLIGHRNSGAGVARGFFYSDELKKRNLSDADYVTMSYRTLLNRDPDAAGFANWTGRLQKGADRSTIVEGFLYSAEFGSLCRSYGIDRG